MRWVPLVLWLAWAAQAFAQTATFSFEGDSISETNQFRWDEIFAGMMQDKMPGSDFHIWALSGDTASNMVSEYVTQAHTTAPTDLGYFTLLAGINDLRAGDTAEHVAEHLASIWADARADGYQVVAFTITPDYNQNPTNQFWREWTNLNAWIGTQTDSYDFLVPMASNLVEADLADGLHPTFAGSQKLAMLVSNTLFAGSATVSINPRFQIMATGITGNTYALQGSADLSNWTDLSTNFVGTNKVFTFTDSPTNPAQFFRTRLVR